MPIGRRIRTRATERPDWDWQLALAVLVPAAILTWTWWHHTPTNLKADAAIPLAVGRLAGLLAGLAAMYQLLLMARIGPLERRIGSDRLTRLHAKLGRLTLLLVLVHVPLVTWGYSGATRTRIRSEISILWSQYPYIWQSVVAAGLLIVVAATAANRIRRRLPYELWYYTHLLAYVALALAFGHQITTGSDFIHNTLERAIWSTAWIVVTTAVAYWRIAQPVWQAASRRTYVDQIEVESADTTSIHLRGRRLADVGAQPGQFFRLRLMRRGLWWQSHPYSLSAGPADHWRFTVKGVGQHSRALRKVAAGTRVIALGPYGTLTADRATSPHTLLIAAGIGITPLRALFEKLPERGGRTTLIYRARSEQDLLFRNELDELATADGRTVVYLVGDRDSVGEPLSEDALGELVPDLPRHDVFICAPAPLTATLVDRLRRLGVPRNQIHWESFELADSPLRPRTRPLATAGALLVVALLLGLRTQMFTRGSEAVALGPVSGASATASPSGSQTGTLTIAGPAERTLYSSVQVRITWRSGHLIDVQPISLPNRDARSRQLSAMAAPILRQEALASNGTRVDVVTGATYTSGAYEQSLAGALADVPK